MFLFGGHLGNISISLVSFLSAALDAYTVQDLERTENIERLPARKQQLYELTKVLTTVCADAR